MGALIIGVDPHKASATIEVRDEQEVLRATATSAQAWGLEGHVAQGARVDVDGGSAPQRLRASRPR